MLKLSSIPVQGKNENSLVGDCMKVTELAKIHNFHRNQINIAHQTSKNKMASQHYFTRKVIGKTFIPRRRKLVKFM